MKRIKIQIENVIITLNKIEGNLYNIQFENFEDINCVIYKEVINKFNEKVVENDIEIMSFDVNSYEERNKFLNKSILKISSTKVLFSKELKTKISLNLSKYNFLSCDKISTTELYSLFKEVSIGDIEVKNNHKKYLDEMIEMAGASFNLSNWKVVYHLNNKIGLLFPQLYPDENKEGSMFYIGLLPKYRRQKHGSIIHAHGLNLLLEQGANLYIGSTNETNKAMLKIFNLNNCMKKYSQIFYKK